MANISSPIIHKNNDPLLSSIGQPQLPLKFDFSKNKTDSRVLLNDDIVIDYSSPSIDFIPYGQLLSYSSSPSSTINMMSSSAMLSSSNEDNESTFFTEQFGNIALVIFYSLIVLVSLFGNVFVCKVMLGLFCHSGATSSSVKTTTNVLILNLAISDLLLTCFNIPINIVRFVSTNWPFGSIICTLTPFFQSLSAHCSSITMMVIAFERYRSLIGFSGCNICWRLCCCLCLRKDGGTSGGLNLLKLPSTYGSQKRSSIINHHQHSSGCSGPMNRSGQSSWIRLIVLIWLCSIVLSIPHCLFNRVVVYPSFTGFDSGMVRCKPNFPNEQLRLMLAILSPLSQYLLPIGLTALFYARIGCFLWSRSDPVGNVSENRRASIFKRKRKRVKMLVFVVAVFAICWLPLHLYVTLADFHIIQHHFGIYFVTHWIAMSSVCYNPFIYCWLNESFRRRMNPLVNSLTSLQNAILVACCFIRKPTTITINTENHSQNNCHSGQPSQTQVIKTQNGTTTNCITNDVNSVTKDSFKGLPKQTPAPTIVNNYRTNSANQNDDNDRKVSLQPPEYSDTMISIESK